jgi:hypothetical protein
MLTHYRIDEDHGNPYRLWEQWDGPVQPSDAQLAALRAEQELTLFEPARVVQSAAAEIRLMFPLKLPGVSLILLTPAGVQAPSAPGPIATLPCTGLNGRKEVLLSWGAAEGAAPIRYEIEVSTLPEGPYSVVDTPPMIASAWLEVPDVNFVGRHIRVRAIDAWDNESVPSLSLYRE